MQASSPIRRIRLDLSNAPSAVLLHKIALKQDDGAVLWEWDAGKSVLTNIRGLSVRKLPVGVVFLCWNDDPQFDLDLPREVLTELQSSVSVVVELTPRPLADVFGEVLELDDRQISDLSASAVKKTALGMAGTTQYLSLGFSRELESVSGLLKNALARRDQIIAEQSKQIRVMRDEILRAEAQLDLLKDVMLGGRGEDRL